jgi:hypothetical protein
VRGHVQAVASKLLLLLLLLLLLMVTIFCVSAAQAFITLLSAGPCPCPSLHRCRAPRLPRKRWLMQLSARCVLSRRWRRRMCLMPPCPTCWLSWRGQPAGTQACVHQVCAVCTWAYSALPVAEAASWWMLST